MVLEESDEEKKKTQKQVRHGAAIVHIDRVVQYREKEDNSLICDKLLLKSLQSQIQKKHFT